MPSTIAPPSTSGTPRKPPAGGLALEIDLPSGRVVLSGELDRDTTGHLEAACRLLGDAGPPVWVLDVAELTFCDAPGLRALTAVRRAAEDAGAALLLVGARPFLRGLLPLAGLGNALTPVARVMPGRAAERVAAPPIARPAPNARAHRRLAEMARCDRVDAPEGGPWHDALRA